MHRKMSKNPFTCKILWVSPVVTMLGPRQNCVVNTSPHPSRSSSESLFLLFALKLPRSLLRVDLPDKLTLSKEFEAIHIALLNSVCFCKKDTEGKEPKRTYQEYWLFRPGMSDIWVGFWWGITLVLSIVLYGISDPLVCLWK